MSSLLVRRILVFVVSFAVGGLISFLFVTLVLPWMGPNQGAAITIQSYGIQYFFWTLFPLSIAIVIWLDYFLDTRILPD
ncbi:MAG TPA: hypothetical protein VHD90_11405 [Phototrophicaceae bacterium]|nr:hypothetical protein [Phototrophicaceae bacterium]